MNILILGQGGREHALAWKIKQSELCDQLYVAPGNGGTSEIAKNLALDVMHFDEVCRAIQAHDIGLVVVGPEVPLAHGIVDHFEAQLPSLAVIGPRQKGAQLEASKSFAKAFMQRHQIPTAKFQIITGADFEQGVSYIKGMQTPIVLKADGLAAGKGVVICQSHSEATQVLKNMLGGQFGTASHRVVIEEFLAGREYSMFILTDGTDYFQLPTAKDYKRIGEGDHGPNTGGMGAVSPVPFVDNLLFQKTVDQVIKPTLKGLQEEAIPFVGFIFFGMIEVRGEPYVIEYNCRLGDPETESILPRIQSDFVAHLVAATNGTIQPSDLIISSQATAAVMLVSGGYPESYEKGKLIKGCDRVTQSHLFHAGTRMSAEGLVSNGGRVMAMVSTAANFQNALNQCYESIKHVYFEKQYYRRDIGFDL